MTKPPHRIQHHLPCVRPQVTVRLTASSNISWNGKSHFRPLAFDASATMNYCSPDSARLQRPAAVKEQIELNLQRQSTMQGLLKKEKRPAQDVQRPLFPDMTHSARRRTSTEQTSTTRRAHGLDETVAEGSWPNKLTSWYRSGVRIVRKYVTFIGPGFIIAVSYIDPGNYSTDFAAGTLFEYKMLFILFLTNLFAIFLQSLSCKLGCVTGLNLPELCRRQFPLWANIILYVIFEAASSRDRPCRSHWHCYRP